MEVAGLLVGVPGLVKLLLEVTLDGYKTFSSARSCGKDIGSCLLLLEVERERLKDWIRHLSNGGGDLSKVIDPTTNRYCVVLEVLSQMAGLFAQVGELESKYGIRRVEPRTGNQVGTKLPLFAEGGPTAERVRKRDVLRQKFHALRPGSGGVVFNTGYSDPTLKKATTPKLKAAASSTPNLHSYDNTKLNKYKIDSDLEITAPRMTEVVEGVEKKAKIYRETLSSYRQFEWAFSTKEELENLIRDLKEYNDALIKLTAPFTIQGEILQVPEGLSI
jgi:hypothetical protein